MVFSAVFQSFFATAHIFRGKTWNYFDSLHAYLCNNLVKLLDKWKELSTFAKQKENINEQ